MNKSRRVPEIIRESLGSSMGVLQPASSATLKLLCSFPWKILFPDVPAVEDAARDFSSICHRLQFVSAIHGPSCGLRFVVVGVPSKHVYVALLLLKTSNLCAFCIRVFDTWGHKAARPTCRSHVGSIPPRTSAPVHSASHKLRTKTIPLARTAAVSSAVSTLTNPERADSSA